MYGVHDADPVTGGCPLWIKSDLSPDAPELQIEPATDATTSAAPASDESATIETEFGAVSYTVPAGSYADPRPPTPMPDFVLGQGRWVVPDCCHVFVTLQSIEPPYPDEELVDTFVANGIEWNVYDTGPQNGTITTARATDGPITVLVVAQGLFTDPPGPATLPITDNVTRSVVIDLTGN